MPFQKGKKNPMYGVKHDDEWKKRMSELQKGKPKSEETRRRMKEAHKNDPGRPKGYKHTEESKKKMSERRKGIKFSEEHLRNLSESHKGQKVSEEGRKKRSEYNKSHPDVVRRLQEYRIENPSAPQLELYEHIKEKYMGEKVELEWELSTSEGQKFIDVAIPDRLLGFEYDDPHYHKDKEKDQRRHDLIESLGWKLIHYSSVEEFKK